MTLVNCITSEFVRKQAVKNIRKKLPAAEKKLQELINSSVNVVDNPTSAVVESYKDQVRHDEDAPVLAAAIENGCRYLVTFNTRHFRPNSQQITVIKPGELLEIIREILEDTL